MEYKKLAFLYLGRAKRSLKNYEDSIEDFKKVLEIDPNNTSAINSIGVAYFEFKKYKKAVEYFNKAVLLISDKTFIGGSSVFAFKSPITINGLS